MEALCSDQGVAAKVPYTCRMQILFGPQKHFIHSQVSSRQFEKRARGGDVYQHYNSSFIKISKGLPPPLK